ncbi:hypothetical protein [Flavobacterium daejeonense]|uniref:hypothetical protein n=1 Tax=Flavobacterium daejeonense TaxID=350893 RepID=UPI000478E7F1|nr:hypothetical protein [Flavobacterium daejeonense]
MINKSDIKKLIIENKKSNLKNHWKDAFFCNTTKYSGEIKSNEILLWRSSEFLRGYYPIYILNFDRNENLKEIKIEKNLYHKYSEKFTFIFFLILLILLAIFENLQTSLILVTGLSVIIFLLQLILSKARKYETKLLTKELKDTIQNIERKKNPELIIESEGEEENEFTTPKFFTRLLLYPFCIFFIWFFTTNFSPKEMNIKIFTGIGIVLIYLISDIILLIKKKVN